MRNQFLYTVGVHTTEMHGSCKIALYMVLLSDVDGDILLLPVGVRHVRNARTWLPTLLYYTLLRRIAFKKITFSTSRAIFIVVHARSGKIHFTIYKSSI